MPREGHLACPTLKLPRNVGAAKTYPTKLSSIIGRYCSSYAPAFSCLDAAPGKFSAASDLMFSSRR